MPVRVTSHANSGHDIVAGTAPFDVEVTVRPVGQLEFPERTWNLLKGPFSEKYVPDLIDALQEAHRIASRPEPWRPHDHHG
jgi:hypothetical protein